MTNRQSAHLDMIRGCAAIAVVIGHVRGLFLSDYPDVVAHKRTLAPFYALTGLGHQSVMIFFVLSGFLIGGSVLAARDRWSWKNYSINRLTRLYVVLLPALFLTALLDHFAYAAPGGHTYFDFPIKHFNAQPLAHHESFRVFLGNAAFLQTIRVPVFGADSPLWSLANEFWYYLLFPAAILALLPGPINLAGRLIAAIIAVVLFVWLPVGIRWGFLTWLLGVAVYCAPGITMSVTKRSICVAIAGALFTIFLALSRIQRISADYSDLAVGVGFALWLACLVRIAPMTDEISRRYRSFAKVLSGCSYSVYAVHFPVVMLIRCIAGTKIWQPNVAGMTIWLTISFVAFLVGYVFSLLTEKHTGTVRRFVCDRIATHVTAAGGTANSNVPALSSD